MKTVFITMTLCLSLTGCASLRSAEQQAKLDEHLIVASYRLDTDSVRALLASGADPTARFGRYNGDIFADKWDNGGSPWGSEDWTALQAVAHSERHPRPEEETPKPNESERDSQRVLIAELLLAAGADINAADKQGGTPLAAATYLGHQALALFLIEQKADPNTKTGVYIDGPSGITPLHRATHQPSVLAALLKAGADVDPKDSIGETPLAWATGQKEIESVRLLLNAGADSALLDPAFRTRLISRANGEINLPLPEDAPTGFKLRRYAEGIANCDMFILLFPKDTIVDDVKKWKAELEDRKAQIANNSQEDTSQ